METIFTQALGLTPPWVVSGYEFSPDAGRIDFHLRCDAVRLSCPACGAPDQPIHPSSAVRAEDFARWLVGTSTKSTG